MSSALSARSRSAVYAVHPFDRVMCSGDIVGVSTWIGYTFNEAKWLTLAVIDADYAEPGTELTFVWGEENGGTSKPTVEPHVQRELRAVVSPPQNLIATRITVPSDMATPAAVSHNTSGEDSSL